MSKRWGVPTWYFFHTFAEKITTDLFQRKREECLSIIESICPSLPCPYCKDHARNYLKTHNFDSIKTKEELKMFLFKFHNDVNRRKKQKIESENILEQYSRVNMVNALKYFRQEFFRNYFIANHFSGWVRNILLEKLIDFFKKNISGFHP